MGCVNTNISSHLLNDKHDHSLLGTICNVLVYLLHLFVVFMTQTTRHHQAQLQNHELIVACMENIKHDVNNFQKIMPLLIKLCEISTVCGKCFKTWSEHIQYTPLMADVITDQFTYSQDVDIIICRLVFWHTRAYVHIFGIQAESLLLVPTGHKQYGHGVLTCFVPNISVYHDQCPFAFRLSDDSI